MQSDIQPDLRRIVEAIVKLFAQIDFGMMAAPLLAIASLIASLWPLSRAWKGSQGLSLPGGDPWDHFRGERMARGPSRWKPGCRTLGLSLQPGDDRGPHLRPRGAISRGRRVGDPDGPAGPGSAAAVAGRVGARART